MPILKKFIIKNFRGIQEAELTVDGRKTSNVITLIGLNESGKTTILEALSHFSTGDRTIPNLVAQSENKEHLISLIPIDKRAAFTGDVEIIAIIGFEPGEFRKYLDRAEKEFNEKIGVHDDVEEISVNKSYEYKDSKFVRQMNYWSGIELIHKGPKSKNFKRTSVGSVEKDKYLHNVVNSVEKDLFELVYFPTFIVDMPSRIYLEPHAGETAINMYYRKVIEDVLKSVGEGIDLKLHVIDRLKEAKLADATAGWFSTFWGKPDRKLIDSVLNKIQTAINREVIGSWAKVFKHSISSRSVKIEWNIDASKNDMAYLSFGISDGQSTFSIHERSLGFRWFFSYLLFTQFRSKSGRKTIFLFDEPAANLHAKAQIELMESIARIVGGGNKVIYSTHSPHMINPNWLGDAFIVENQAVDITAGADLNGFDTKTTDIKAIGYGTFVGAYPEKRTYFQPVWEKLLYEAPPIVGAGPFLCVEGISDFFFLSYVSKLSEKKYNFSLVPGVGAGGFTSALPSLYGSGAPFVLLLDDDAQGRLEKNRYVEDGLLAISQVFTLGDVDSQFHGRKLESILSPEAIDLVKHRFSGKSGKRQIGMYLAEIAASAKSDGLDSLSIKRGAMILDWASSVLK